MIVLVVVVGVALVGVVAYLAHKAEVQRREALAALAAELGWTFEPARDRGFDEEHAQFGVFRRGHSRAALNTMRGRLGVGPREHGGRMGDFEYKITTSNGKSTTTRTIRTSYIVLRLAFPRLPDLLIRRETVLDKLADAIGFDDIDFESSEFSRKFHVKSRDKRFAYDVVHPRMMEFLLADPGLGADIEGGCVLVCGDRGRWTPAEFRVRLEWVRRFLELWPEHVVSELEGKGAARA